MKSWTNKAIVMTKTFHFGLWCRNSHTNWLLCAGMKWQNEAHHFLHGIVTLMVDNWRFDLLSRKKPARSSSSSSPYVFGINDNIIIIFIVDFDVMVICDRILHKKTFKTLPKFGNGHSMNLPLPYKREIFLSQKKW